MKNIVFIQFTTFYKSQMIAVKTLANDPINTTDTECEVVVKKIDKKTQDRQIFINGKLNYDKEMYWIAPIKNAELERMQKIEAKNNQRNEKLKKRLKKREKNEK